jgi:hypothetical protein
MMFVDMTDLIHRPPYLYYLTNVSTQYLALQTALSLGRGVASGFAGVWYIVQ